VQYYDFRQPQQTALLGIRLTDYGEATNLSMGTNRLQLNAAMTDVLWCGFHRRVSQLPSVPLQFGGNSINPSSVVCDLGVWIDNGITMSTHVNKVAAVLRQLQRSVRRSVTREGLTSFVFVFSCNALLAGLSSTQIDRLQSVENAVARIIFAAHRRDRVTPQQQQLHWLHERQTVSCTNCVH
jgi:hypothetical protein